MDFKSLELPEIMEVHIADPMGEKLYSDDEMKKPVIIGLHLPQSKAMRVYDNKIHNKTLKLVKKRNSNKITTSLEESREEDIDRLVAYTAKIENFIYDGKEVTLDQVRKIYENVHLAFITSQLNKRLENYSSFLEE